MRAFSRVNTQAVSGAIPMAAPPRPVQVNTMPLQETIYQVARGVATITLNRPDKLNAWTATMEKEVRSSLEEAARDDGVRVIVLTGAGRGFCAGADMSLLTSVAAQALPGGERDAASLLGGSSPHREDVLPDFQKKYSYFPGIEKPILAAINGPVVGLGLVIALYCDVRLASDAARFSTTFAQRGLFRVSSGFPTLSTCYSPPGRSPPLKPCA
jgi:enoyl-CoA hydratase/carnithine racemase